MTEPTKPANSLKRKRIYTGGLILLIVAILAVVAYFYAQTQNEDSTENEKPAPQTEQKPEVNPDKQEISTDEYANPITPDGIAENAANGKPQTIYFYREDCEYCQQATPVIFPLTEELDIELLTFDTNQFNPDTFGVTGTPTIIHYDANGDEVDRVIGNVPKEAFRAFFTQVVLTDN